MAVTDTWAAGNSFAASDADNVARAINGSGWLAPCHYATTGTETFTLSGGSVITINGTTLDGGSPSVGDRVLVKDAPATSGTGNPLSSQPGNGVYAVTGVSSNLTLSRVYEMSASPSPAYFPGGWVVAVMAGTVSAGLTYIIRTPNNPATAFTYGTNSIQFAPSGYLVGTGLTLTGSTLGLSSATQSALTAANSSLQSASGVLMTSGSSVLVSPMSTGQILYGSAGVPTIGTVSGDVALASDGTVTVNAGAITYAKMANIAGLGVIGNTTSGGAPTTIPTTSNGAANSLAGTTSTGALVATTFVSGVATTVTAGGTTALSASSVEVQQFTGTATQTVTLPQGTTLAAGRTFYVTNRSTSAVTVQTFGGASLQVLAAGSQCKLTLISNSTSAGTWDASYTISGLAGTLTGVSVASSNGFSGASSGGSTPVLTLSTTITGLLKGNGTALSAAVSGTDYAPPTTGTALLKANGSGGFSAAVSGTDYAPKTPTGTNALASNGVGGFQTATLNTVAAPTTSFSMGGNLLTNVATPVSSTDAATKGYVDTAIQGIDAMYSAVAGTNTETLTIASGSVTSIAGTTVNGQSPSVGDYILVMNAPGSTGAAGGSTLSTVPANGLYQVTSNTTNLAVARAASMAGSNSPAGAYVFVEGGSLWASGGFIVTTPNTSAAFTYGTGSIQFTQFTGAGEITAGSGLTKSGNTLSIALTAGTAISITNNSTTIGVANNSIGLNQFSATGTTSSATYLRGDNTWAPFNSAVGSAFTAGTGISIAGSTISIAASSIGPSLLSATGTQSSATYLRGDNTWASFASGLGSTSISALTAPTATVGWGGYGITGVANPTSAQDATTKVYVDSTGYHPYCRVATTGVETYTVSGGTVTQISGTTIDGVSPAVGDRVLIKDAPATSGSGSILSTQPGNGIYVITNATTNLTLSRVGDLSSGGSSASPAGTMVEVVSGSANALTCWKVSSPASGAFTYGTTGIQWTPDINAGTGLTRTGNVLSVSTAATGTALLGTTIASGKSFTVANTLGLTGTDGTSFAFPSSSDTVVTLAATQALTNKTLSAATNTFVNIPNSALAGAPGSTIVGINDNQTLINKTISGVNNTLSNIGISSLAASGTASSTTFLRGDGAWASPPSTVYTGGTAITVSGTTISVTGAPSGAFVGTTDTQALTNKDLTGAGNTFPTFNQNTTGNAASATTAGSCSGNAATATKLATARTIGGVSFDGTANIAQPYDLSMVVFGSTTTRATGTGDNPFGIRIARSVFITTVWFRFITGDASGSTTFQVQRNGTTIGSGSFTSSATSFSLTNVNTTFSAGDILTVNLSTVGTTPGLGLVADFIGTCS